MTASHLGPTGKAQPHQSGSDCVAQENSLMPADPAAIDIVIPTRDRGHLIAATIHSILSSSQSHFQLWIVDQSEDELTATSVAAIAGQDARVHYLHATPHGSNWARNVGASTGRGDYILFTDDDCLVSPDWVNSMVQELATNGTSAVFGQILPIPAGATEGRPVDQKTTQALPIALKDEPQREVYEGNRFNLGFGHGANMGLTRRTYQRVGGFDNLLAAGGALRSWPERDLGYRILLRGGRIVYTPKALVYHRHWRGWEELRRTYRNYGIGTGAAVAKYVRSGDWAAIYLLLEWFVGQGLRPMLSGLLKWHSYRKIVAGGLQLIYPWVGLVQSLRYPVDREHIL